MRIHDNVLAALSDASTSGPSLVLQGTLDRKLYLEVNKVIVAAGGKWNKKAKSHIFDSDAADVIDQIILSGEVTNKKQEFGFFESPPPVIARLIEISDISPHHRVLEPSAGTGLIVKAIGSTPDKVAVETNKDLIVKLISAESGLHVIEADFLECGEEIGTFDRIVMNPPFARHADIHHVMHAATFLRNGGRLVSVMSAGVMFREDRITKGFRDFVSIRGGTFEALPDGAFKASGTNVRTLIVSFDN